MYPMDTVKPLWNYIYLPSSSFLLSELLSQLLELERVTSSAAAGRCKRC